MIKLVYLFAGIIFYSSVLYAQNNENKYAIKNIHPGLQDNAGAVIREYSLRFEIEDQENAIEKIRFAVTIFKKEKQHYGELSIWYDKLREIDDLEGFIYDADGNEIRELEESDIKDFSSFDDNSLYTDNRIKYLELYNNRYPYTLEFIYELRYDGYLNWPVWYSRSSTDPVQYSSFEVLTPSNYNLRYWSNKDDFKPLIIDNKENILYKWERKNIEKLSSDADEEDIEDYAEIIRIAPGDFEIEGYSGNMSTWKDFGYWYYNLYKEKDNLPAAAFNEIADKINTSTGIKEKIEFLYKYMQSRTRYISVQLGIGGWQPFDAEYVHNKGYGDCKALSNYMISLLKNAGINAYPVLIKNGHHRFSLIKDFPSNQFNHVIVCVPMENDTIWLECTSQKLPIGSIGWSNENRDALMVTPEGGVIITTPQRNYLNNVQVKKITVNLDNRGKADILTEIYWNGNQHDYVLPVLDRSSLEKEKWIRDLFEVPDFTLGKYSFAQNNLSANEVNLRLNITIPQYGSFAGKRIFFNPNLMEKRTYIPKSFSARKSPVRLRYPYLDVDSILYTIPAEYKIESIPKENNLESSFGKFDSKIIDNGDNTVIFVRSLEINKYNIPPENYSEYQNFFAEIVKADKQQVVLVKKE